MLNFLLGKIKDTTTLNTARLLLRPFKEEDVDDVYEWCSSPLVTKCLFWYAVRDKSCTERILRKWIRKKRHYSWCLGYQGKAIWEIELIKDLDKDSCEIGSTLSSAYWREGFMKEALKEVLHLCLAFFNRLFVIAVVEIKNAKRPWTAVARYRSAGVCGIDVLESFLF